MRLSTIILLVVAALVVIGLRGHTDELRAALPSGSAQMSAIAVRDASVKQVVSGDTFELENGQVVRLLQVDAPEVGEHAECFGTEARAWLAGQLPAGTRVRMKRDPDLPERDKNGHLLRYVYRASDTVFINERAAHTGAGAPYFMDETRGVHADKLERVAAKARKAPVGLWRVCEGTSYAPERNIDTGPPLPPSIGAQK